MICYNSFALPSGVVIYIKRVLFFLGKITKEIKGINYDVIWRRKGEY